MAEGTGGFGSGLGNLFQNKMFLQYLSAAGGAMSAGQPVGPALNQVTQQNIASQSHLGLLKKMLAGYPAGTKVSADDKGFSLKIPNAPDAEGMPTDKMTPDFGAINQGSAGSPLANAPAVPVAQVPQSPTQPTINPMQQNQAMSQMLAGGDLFGNISANDLAGLSPAEISNALQLKFSQDKMVQDQLNFERTFDFESQKYIASLDKDERTPAIKNYQFAQSQGYQDSFADFDKDVRTSHQKDYEYAVKQGYTGKFQQWVEEMAKAGAIQLNMGDKVELHKQIGQSDQQLKVTEPGYEHEITKKLMNSKSGWFTPPQSEIDKIKVDLKLTDDDEAVKKLQQKKVLEALDADIKQAFKGKKVTHDRKGWYVDGEFVRGNPYAK